MIVISLLAALCGLCCAETPYDGHSASKELLERKPLRLSAEGQVGLPFERAESILMQKDLLTAVQKSYAAGLPEGEDPEFTVEQISPGVYHYVNSDGDKTTIEEVWVRRVPREKNIHCALFRGVAFFREIPVALQCRSDAGGG